MSHLIIGNGRLITRTVPNELIENGAVVVEKNLIKEIGDTNKLRKKYAEAEFIDAFGGVIMPGLINAHNHIYSAFARGVSIKNYSPKTFLEILDGLWWTLDRNLLLEDTYYSAMVTYIDCIKNGCTTVFDHHASYGGIRGSLFRIADAAKELGVRTSLCYEVSDRNGEEQMLEAIEENAEFIKYTQSDNTDMIKAMMGMHASFTLSDKTMEKCIKNTPNGIGYHIHVAEGTADVEDSISKYKKRVINRLFDLGILGEKTITGHCIHVNENEMDLLKETNTMVVHNPESNMGNAVGIPPAMEMIKKGIMLGLGTDGYTNDMLESEKVANIIHKHVLADPGAAWSEVPQMLFYNNQTICDRCFNTKIGVLETGAAADIIISDYIPQTPMTAANCDGHILFGMSGRSITTTIINGKVKMKNREFIGIDTEKIYAKSREHSNNVWERINS
ncbi:MAG: putative aminohydrolase SsnA [Oscillospiraceae bacterium]|jgi:putative selenium metabolism protein SsnA|nr:putative aminohydrolase SsnA [Oscillospiraceae bacterium]